MSDHDMLTVTEGGMRLDKRLTTQLPYSRSFFVHLFDRDAVTLRGRIAKKSYKVKTGDKIHIASLDRFVDGGILDEAPAIDLPVHHDTEDYLVLYKPKGILSHPNSIRDVGQGSVVGFLYHRYRELPSIGSFIRAGLIHRLDKGTDGLMLAAKTERGLAYFKNLFQTKSAASTIADKEVVPLKKYYRTRCDITPEGQQFIDSIAQYPHLIDSDVVPAVPYPVVKRGLTKILSTEVQDHQCIVDVEILTGRTHQIRYHLSQAGLPIVGDYLYHPEYEESDELQLTAYQLAFTDMYGEQVVCSVSE